MGVVRRCLTASPVARLTTGVAVEPRLARSGKEGGARTTHTRQHSYRNARRMSAAGNSVRAGDWALCTCRQSRWDRIPHERKVQALYAQAVLIAFRGAEQLLYPEINNKKRFLLRLKTKRLAIAWR